MDLAKIRKKSLLALNESDEISSATLSDVESAETLIPTESQLKTVGEIDVCDAVSAFSSPVNEISSLSKFTSISTEKTITQCSPLEAILNSRTAAGCDDDSALSENMTGDVIIESYLEFLCFRVSDEIYGINIMDIKEIIKPREVTEVPRAPEFVSGVLSLRGTIIPIIDMRIRLGLAHEEQTGKERIIVIKNENSFSGLLVDEVIQVVQIPQDAVESAPTVLDGIDRDFVSGIGRSDGRLIIILNLEKISDINLY